MIRRVLKYLTYFVSFILLLIVGLLAFTQTKAFREVLREKSLQLINPNINGHFSIEQIDGNLYNTICLKNISLTEGDSLIAQIDTLCLNYHLKDLFKKHIVIDTFLIQSPQFNLWYKDSTTLHLLYVLENIIKNDKSTPSNFPITLDVRHIELNKGNGQFQTKYSAPPIRFSEIDINASGFFKNHHVEVNIKQIDLATENPQFELIKSHVNFKKERALITVDSLQLQTGKSFIKAKGQYIGMDNFDIQLNANPLDNQEIKTFLPTIPLKTIPELSLKLESNKAEMHCDISLANKKKNIGVKAISYELPKALKTEDETSKYNATIYFNNFIPEDWFEINKTDAKLNGSVTINGVNILNYKDDLKLNAQLNNSSYRGTISDTLNIDAIQKNNVIDASLIVVYNDSHSKGHLNIEDLYDTPIYTAIFKSQNLNIEAIEPSLPNTIVNGEFNISGTHILSDQRQFTSQIGLYNSKVYDVNVDSVFLQSDFSEGNLHFDTLNIITANNMAYSSGNYNFIQNAFNTQISIRSKNLDLLKKYDVPELDYKDATLRMQLNGTTKSFDYEGDVNVTNLNVYSLNTDTVFAQLSGSYSKDSINSDGTINVKNLDLSSQSIEDISLDYSFKNNIINALLKVKDDSTDAHLEALIELKDTIDIQLLKGNLQTPYANYYLTDTIQQVSLATKSVFINNIEIKDHTHSAFKIKTKGQISTEQSENFDLLIRNLNLSRLNHLINTSDTIGGLLSSTLSLNGKPDSLVLKSSYTITNPNYGDINIPSINGEISYDTSVVKLNAWLPQLDSAVHANFSIPFTIGTDTNNKLNYNLSDTFNAQLNIYSLNISTPDIPEYEHINAGGIYSGKINVAGTFDKPDFTGFVNIDNGFLTNHNQGVYYKNALARFKFDENTINIDTIYIGADKGYFTTKGHVTFDSTIISGKISNSAFKTDIKRFHIVKHKNYDMSISGNPFVSSDKGSPLFGGKITVNNSSFFIPGLLKTDETETNTNNTPLLVAAINENHTTTQVEDLESQKARSPFIDQLHGRITIDIPRSTWLKSNDMNIEIAGDFDIAKTGSYFELFGDVEVIRGYYILYGRKYNISEGIITFMGGENPDPRLDIKANYTFRSSDKEKHTLELSITEYLSEPVINFTLDDNPISQSDAVSIMIFGKTMDELSYDGQNGIIGSVGSNMLANMVTSSLNSTIGKRFKLDMIEVNSTENWESAAFVVGKYITNDLFVIYQRGFGETEDDEITPETITLEYELNKRLFFRLQSGTSKTSGFDVILKFESKK